MEKLILELPDRLLRKLKQRAAEQNRQVEEVIVEQLTTELDREGEPVDSRLDQFHAESELLERPTEAESQRYRALTEDELDEIGRKLVAAGPLSETIIQERRQGH